MNNECKTSLAILYHKRQLELRTNELEQTKEEHSKLLSKRYIPYTFKAKRLKLLEDKVSLLMNEINYYRNMEALESNILEYNKAKIFVGRQPYSSNIDPSSAQFCSNYLSIRLV